MAVGSVGTAVSETDFVGPTAGVPAAGNLSRLDERYGLTDGLTLVSADNATLILEDQEGRQREYVDFVSAYGAVNFGHRNPEIDRCLALGSDIVGMCYPAQAGTFAAWLCERLDRPASGRVLFQVGGSFGVSTAIALAQHARPGRIAPIRGGFHGLGVDTLAITSVHRSLALQETPLTRQLDAHVATIEPGELPRSWDGISCLIYEPIQGANGYVPLDIEWLRELERDARAAGVVSIADEVQCGFFRHGVLSPSHTAGLRPDIVVYSKSITNGLYPLSAVVYDSRLEPSKQQAFLAHTFQTGSLGFQAASAVASYVDSAPLTELAAGIQRTFDKLAEQLRAEGSAEDVYVTGPSLSFRPTRITARDLVRRALARGLFTFVGGGGFDRVRIAPPLTVPADQLAYGTQILADVLAGGDTLLTGAAPRQSPPQPERAPMERDEFYNDLRTYILESAPRRVVPDGVTDIDQDANLFDIGLVNSFSMMGLLVHLEELLEVSIDVTQHEPETFFTLRGMYDNLVTQGARP